MLSPLPTVASSSRSSAKCPTTPSPGASLFKLSSSPSSPTDTLVLNDNFRFLKEETVESDDASDTADVAEAPAPVAAPQPEVVSPVITAPAPEPCLRACSRTHSPSCSCCRARACSGAHSRAPSRSSLRHPPPLLSSSSLSQCRLTALHTPEPEHAAPAAVAATSLACRYSRACRPPSQVAPAPAPEPVAAPAAAPAVASTPPQAAAAPVAPQPAAPSGPRTWASLAASNPKKWGAAVAQESRGTTETLASSPASNSAAHTPSATPAPAAPPRPQAHAHPAR